jgi:hypothetical protein
MERYEPMEHFEWATNNLGAPTPHELQSRGIDVFFAPNIDDNAKVIDLADGTVDRFFPGQERPPAPRYYADYDSLARYCLSHGIPLVETDGQITMHPVGSGEAGDPLQHRDRG